jgi:peptide subunit release factor RF-3
VQPQSETVWRQANKYLVPRIAFINKMDRVGADFDAAIDSMHKKLGANAWPVLIPLGKEDYLKGQLDVVNRKAVFYLDDNSMGSTYEVREIPEENKEQVEKAYATLVEQISDIDDEIAEAVLEEKEVTPQMLKAGIRRQTIANKFVPVVGGSAFKNKGVSTSSTRSSITSRARSTFRQQLASIRTTQRRRSRRRQTTTASSARLRSSSGAILSSVSSFSSACIPVRSLKATPSTTRVRTNASASRD